MGFKVTVPPADEPVTLAEAKKHFRVLDNREDTLIRSLITTAREMAEVITARALFTQTQVLTLDAFPYAGKAIVLPRSPLQSVSSITYFDCDGVNQTWDNADYIEDEISQPARITPTYGKTYPSTQTRINAVTITYTAGYTDVAFIPYPIKQAILMMAKHWFNNREDTIMGISIADVPKNSEYLLYPYRLMSF